MLLFFSETNQGTLLHSSRFVLQKDHHLSSGKVLLFLFYQSKTSWIFDMSPWEIVTQDNKLFRAASIHANSPAMGEGGGDSLNYDLFSALILGVILHLWLPQKIIFWSLPMLYSKMNKISIVWKKQDLQTCDEFQDSPTALPHGRYNCMVPYSVKFPLLT